MKGPTLILKPLVSVFDRENTMGKENVESTWRSLQIHHHHRQAVSYTRRLDPQREQGKKGSVALSEIWLQEGY